MKLRFVCLLAAVGMGFLALGIFADTVSPTNSAPSTPAVFVPDMSHADDPLPDGVFAWDNVMHQSEAAATDTAVHFVFYFTNATPGNVTILDVHPSCGCTTAQLPDLPWTIPPGTNGQIGITVNISGKSIAGQSDVLFKTVTVKTDKGKKDLALRITIQPPVPMTPEEKAAGIAAAKVDRQAVFKGDCAKCHAEPATGKYGQALYDAVCGVCHESANRATMVPDLHAIKSPTNDQFWQTWIAHGKPGSLMPAFATAEGGPLNDMQIASLAAYLDSAMPSHVVLQK